MAMSAKFETVKTYFELGFWTVENGKMQMAVSKGWITKAEYQTITGQAYKA